jgi:hypothetical protein
MSSTGSPARRIEKARQWSAYTFKYTIGQLADASERNRFKLDRGAGQHGETRSRPMCPCCTRSSPTRR